MRDFMAALLLGYALDLLLGDPAWLYHPVRLIGHAIDALKGRLRRRGGDLRRSAVALAASVTLGTMAAVAALLWGLSLLGRGPLLIGMALLDWMGLAQRSMAREALAVERALLRGIEAGRAQVARIVGRDTQALGEADVIRATVETVAENTVDGVISPMLYAFAGGPVLLWGFKAASTLDSMVGYMDERWRDIGWASARLDDLLNFLPARLTAPLLIAAAALTGLDAPNAARIVRRDHANHLSPNCAWSESAAAGALHVRLGGTHEYFGKPVHKPAIGDDDRPPERADIRRSVRLMRVASALAILLLTLLSIALF